MSIRIHRRRIHPRSLTTRPRRDQCSCQQSIHSNGLSLFAWAARPNTISTLSYYWRDFSSLSSYWLMLEYHINEIPNNRLANIPLLVDVAGSTDHIVDIRMTLVPLQHDWLDAVDYTSSSRCQRQWATLPSATPSKWCCCLGQVLRSNQIVVLPLVTFLYYANTLLPRNRRDWILLLVMRPTTTNH